MNSVEQTNRINISFDFKKKAMESIIKTKQGNVNA